MSWSDGWLGTPDGAPEGEARKRPLVAEDDRRIEALFSTTDGVWFLRWLRERTIEQPAWVPGLDASHGFAREGQNSLVREIEQRMARVRAASNGEERA